MSRAELQPQPAIPEPAVQPTVPEPVRPGPQTDPWLGRVGALAAGAAGGCPPPAPPPPETILRLQRQYGNRYVQRLLQRSAAGSGAAPVSPEVEGAIEQARGTGHALDSVARSSMEQSFGADFGGVRVHTNPVADELNRSLSARAFTTGADIFFRSGEYQPASSAGRELLAHELTHVVQQGAASEVQRKGAEGEEEKEKEEGGQVGGAPAVQAKRRAGGADDDPEEKKEGGVSRVMRAPAVQRCAACEEEERKAAAPAAAPAPLKIQAKLTVGAADDEYEREADEVARRVVMRAPARAVQRKCKKCQEEEERSVRAKPASPGLLQRAPAAKPKLLDQPPPASLSVTLEGMYFRPGEGAVYDDGPKAPQLMAMILNRLLGSQYRPDLPEKAVAYMDSKNQPRQGAFHSTQVAKSGEPIGYAAVVLTAGPDLLDFLETKQKLKVDLSPEQREILSLGAAAGDAWGALVQKAKDNGTPLPGWYTYLLFFLEMGQQGTLLREYRDAFDKRTTDAESSKTQRTATAGKILAAILPPIQALEAVRQDTGLAANPKTQAVYSALWVVVTPPAGGTIAAPTQLAKLETAALFLGWARSQAKVAAEAVTDAARRAELVERFGRFLGSVTLSPPGKTQTIRDTPATANRPPIPSTLSGVPALRPPLFDAALGTDHRFHMQVDFPDIYSAMGAALGQFTFTWERVRIPDDKVGTPVDPTQLAGQQVGNGETAAIRFGRATRYAKADVQRLVSEVLTDLGPAGIGAVELVAVNSILRYAGTGIQFGIELLTKPAGEQHIVFPEPGLYLIRSIMNPLLNGEEEVVRAPSVAYTPVLARDPDEMAAAGVAGAAKSREAVQARIGEIEAKLRNPVLDAKERSALLTEKDDLERALGPVGKTLEHERAKLAQFVDDLKAGRQSGDVAAAQKQLEQLDKILNVRGKRGLEGGESPVARFVSDLGQNLALSLEIVEKPKLGQRVHVVISDLTTPKSGLADGYGESHDAAVLDGLKTLLEGSHGYGRGRVSIQLADGTHTLRIEASLGNLLAESIDNVAMVLSIAAVAAAPFTGGASLALMIPVGIAGAIPSGYRIVERVQAGTFTLDLENAMDLVNIAGSVLGIARLGAGSLRMVRVGRAILVIGYGVDALGGVLMGANLVSQIEELKNLPEGERAAALTMLIGQAMITAGIQVGGALAERASQAHTEAKLKALESAASGEIKPGAPPAPERVQLPGAVDPAAPPKSQIPEAHAREGVNAPPESAQKPAEPAVKEGAARPAVEQVNEAFKKAEDLKKLGPVNEETKPILEQNKELRETLVESPLAAEVLKKCASPCYPPNATREQIQRLERHLAKLKGTGAYDEAALRKYLYDRRGDLTSAIAALEGQKTAGSLNGWLDFLNKRGEGSIEHLPAYDDPAIRNAQVQRAHDIGVKYGQEAAKADGHVPTGFDNPIKGGAYGQGLDDVMHKGPNLDTGDVYIVEYKGGTSQLAPGQMEFDWVVGNIRRLFAEGGPVGEAWARILAKALREGRLNGVAYSTPIDSGTPKPTVKVGDWTYKPTNIVF